MDEIKVYTLNGAVITKDLPPDRVEMNISAGDSMAVIRIGKARLIDEIRKYGIKIYEQKNGARQLWDWRAEEARLNKENGA